jgi:hypothetical protein
MGNLYYCILSSGKLPYKKRKNKANPATVVGGLYCCCYIPWPPICHPQAEYNQICMFHLRTARQRAKHVAELRYNKIKYL